MEKRSSNKPTHKKGDCVIYKSNGICRIADIQSRQFAGKSADYYVLESVYDRHSTWYVPTESEELVACMKHILTKAEIDKLIDNSHAAEDLWVDNYKLRAEKFTYIIKGGDRAQILSLFKALSLYKKEAEGQRRKLYISDERILHSAEKIITEEFSYVLGIPKDDVVGYIISRMEKTAPRMS